MLSDLLYRLRTIVRPATVERELDEELRLHLEHEAAKYERAGLSPEEARRRARLALGGLEQVKEDCRDVRGTRWIEELIQDVRYGVRQLRVNPGFALVALVLLGLGIGANTAIFQLFNAVRLRSLPVPHASELAEIRIAGGNGGMGLNPGRYGGLTRPIWEEIRRDHPAFSGVFAFEPQTIRVGRANEMRRANGLIVSGAFFRILGVPAWRGRIFSDEDEDASCPAIVAVVSYAYWQRAMGGREIGRETSLFMDGESRQVVGVTPPSFLGPAVGDSFDVALPFCRDKTVRRDVFSVNVMGRLQTGWTLDRASTQLAAASPGILEATLPTGYANTTVERYRRFRFGAHPASRGISWLRSEYDASLSFLLGITWMVLLIACANLANLLLARTSSRAHEVSVRMALGASRGRLVRQLLAESGLLAVIGGAAGLAIAQFLSRTLVQTISTDGSIVLPMDTDWRVLLFAGVVATATCLTFGVAPAMRATRTQPIDAMRAQGRGLSAGRERLSLQRLLVISQIAISVVLLVGALLFVRSFWKLATLDPGFRLSGITVTFFGLPVRDNSHEHAEALNLRVLDDLRHVPGVTSAASTTNIPLLGGSWAHGIELGAIKDSSTFTWTSPDYFRTMAIPLLEGRGFTDGDTASSRRVAVVNKTFVHRFIDQGSPIGRVLRTVAEPGYPSTEYEIVGVIADTKYNALRRGTPPMTFAPALQHPRLGQWGTFLVHSDLPPDAINTAVRRALAAHFPEAVIEQSVLETDVRAGLVRERLMALLSGFFGALAALLAMVGLYGLISYLVVRRRAEIGIRLALGATPAEVVSLIVAGAARMVAVGLASGVLLALAIGRVAGAATLLFRLEPHDPVTLITACLLLGLVAGAASVLPARRGAKLDALVALRQE